MHFHLESLFGEIKECSFIRNYGILLKYLLKLSNKEKKLEIVEEKGLLLSKILESEKISEGVKYQQMIAKVEAKLRKLKEEI